MAPPPLPPFHPLHLLLHEQNKFMVAIKDLQAQVQALSDFRSKVLLSFPHLESYMMTGRGGAGGLALPPQQHGKTLSSSSVRGNRVLPSIQVVASNQQQQHLDTSANRPTIMSKSGHRNKQRGDGGAVVTSSGSYRGGGGVWGCDGKKFVILAQGKNWLRIRSCPASGGASVGDSELEDSDEDEQNSTSDSLRSIARPPKPTAAETKTSRSDRSGGFPGHRQDSGFSTDGRVSHHHSSDVRWCKDDPLDADDELMAVLDAIGRKCTVLCDRVERASIRTCQSVTLADIGLKVEDVLTEVDRLRAEREQLLERLVSAESEKSVYRRDAERFRQALVDREAAVRSLEERMDVMVAERERLGNKIHCLHSQFATRGSSASSSSSSAAGVAKTAGAAASLGSDAPPPDAPKLKVHVDRSRISNILSETRTLELQRQLLVSVFRSDVLRARLEQSSGEWQRKSSTWRQTEASLRAEAEVARKSNVQLQVRVHQMETELQAERSKRHVLERALQAAYKDLTHDNGGGRGDLYSHHAPATVEDSPAVAKQYVRSTPNKFAGSPAISPWTEPKPSSVDEGYHRPTYPVVSSTSSSKDTPSMTKRQNSMDSSDDEDTSVIFNTLRYTGLDATDTLAAQQRRHFQQQSSKELLSRRSPVQDTQMRNPRGLRSSTVLPKTYSSSSAPRAYSQSAEDIRHATAEWDWTYDVTKSTPYTRVNYARPASVQRRAMSEART